MNKINIQQNLCKKTSHDLRKYKIFSQLADVVNLKTAFEKRKKCCTVLQYFKKLNINKCPWVLKINPKFTRSIAII